MKNYEKNVVIAQEIASSAGCAPVVIFVTNGVLEYEINSKTVQHDDNLILTTWQYELRDAFENNEGEYKEKIIKLQIKGRRYENNVMEEAANLESLPLKSDERATASEVMNYYEDKEAENDIAMFEVIKEALNNLRSRNGLRDVSLES